MKVWASVSLGLIVFLVACNELDIVSKRYPTLNEAKEDIEKGWIPAILPLSTTAIEDTHDVDSNTGEGSFRFNPKEFDALVNGLSEKVPANPRGVPTKKDLKYWEDKKYIIRTYMADDTLFIVAANLEGDGHYWMALQEKEKDALATP